MWRYKTPLTRNISLWALTGCRVGSVQRSLNIHLLSLLPWQAKGELCLHNIHCSHFPMLPSHPTVSMETSRMSMTAHCVRRGDVMLHPLTPQRRYGFHSAVSEAFDLSFYEQLNRLDNSSCGITCKHKVQRRKSNTYLRCLHHISLDQRVNC